MKYPSPCPYGFRDFFVLQWCNNYVNLEAKFKNCKQTLLLNSLGTPDLNEAIASRQNVGIPTVCGFIRRTGYVSLHCLKQIGDVWVRQSPLSLIAYRKVSVPTYHNMVHKSQPLFMSKLKMYQMKRLHFRMIDVH